MKRRKIKAYEDDDFEAPIIGVGDYHATRKLGKTKIAQIGFVRRPVKAKIESKKKK